MKCECGHDNKKHDEKEGCQYRFRPESTNDYQDVRGYCICTQFYEVPA